ncbi:MAG TPA: hypothetical protein VFA71_13220 [Terriglobales bacterium]|nr:hypothetical protein [Terriglobales bacterium]
MKPEIRSLLFVAIAGAVGGFTSWLLQWLAGLAPFQKPASLGIPALIIVGGVAAIFGVYLIANSDIKELPHTLAFALLCGVFWQPIFDAAKLYVQHSVTVRQGSEQQSMTQNLAAVVASGDQNTVKTKLDETANATTEVLSSLSTVQDRELKQKLVQQSNEAVDQVSKASDKAPDTTVESLQKIGEAAVQSGQPELAGRVLSKLNAIKIQNPALAPNIEKANERIVKGAELKLGTLGTAIRTQR